MKNLNKILSVLLAALLLCQGLVLVSAEESAEALEWTYDNSMLVKINAEESKVFTPEDFPDMNCIQVLTTEKLRIETGYSYELMLIFDTTDGFDWQTTADIISENSSVETVKRNEFVEDFSLKESKLTLTESEVYLAIGESIDVEIDERFFRIGRLPVMQTTFKVDPSLIDESTFTKETFAEYGIRFWPFVLRSLPLGAYRYEADFEDAEIEGTCSPIHEYALLITREETSNDFRNFKKYINQINAIATTEWVDEVNVLYSYLPSGSGNREEWYIDDEAVVSLSVWGGITYENTDNFYYQTATITGKTIGTAILSCQYRVAGGTNLVANCTAHVYDPKDVNFDGVANSLDAAQVLKYDAELVEESALHNYYGKTAGDVNFDGEINSLDAAVILRYDAGLE